MSGSVSINEILNPEEFAACRAYFTATSNNTSDGLAEPPCFRIWLRLVLATLRQAKPTGVTESELTVQAPSSASSSSTPTLARAPSVAPNPPGSFVTVPQVIISSKTPNTEPTRPVPSPPTEPSATKAVTKSTPKTPIAPTAPSHLVKISTNPQTAATVAPPPDKSVTTVISKPPENPSTNKPSASVLSQVKTETSNPTVVARPTPVPASQTAKNSNTVPRPATSSVSVSNPSASGPRAPSSFTISNATLQPTVTRTASQTAAKPGPSLPPAAPAKAPSAVPATAANSGHTPTPSVLSHPAAPPPANRLLQANLSTSSIASSPTGQSSGPIPSASALTSKPTPQSITRTPTPSNSLKAQIEGQYEARGDTKIAVHSSLYEGLFNFYLQHRGCTHNPSPSSQSAPQTSTASHRVEKNADPPAQVSNKRTHDTANAKTQRHDRRIDEEEQKDHSRDSDTRDRRSSHGGSRDHQTEHNQYNASRRKRRRRNRHYYDDYYDDDDDWWW